MDRKESSGSEIPLTARWTLIGAALFGAVGAIVGLVVDLQTYAATAWFDTIEVGIPAAFVGGLFGFALGLVVTTWHRFRQDG